MKEVIIGIIVGLVLSFVLFPRDELKADLAEANDEIDSLEECIGDHEELLSGINYEAGNARYSVENYELEDAYIYTSNLEDMSSNNPCY